jgi:hypothetical protein
VFRFNEDQVDAAVVQLRKDHNYKIPMGVAGADLGDYVILFIAHFFDIRIAYFPSFIGSERAIANPIGRGEITLIQSCGNHYDAVVSNELFVPDSTPSSNDDIKGDEVADDDAASSSDDDAASSSDDDAASSSDDDAASSSDDDAASSSSSSPVASYAASSSPSSPVVASSFAFGADVITSHFVCIKKLQDIDHDGLLDRAMTRCGINADDMAIAINHCPPHHSCAFLTSILRDMKAQQQSAAVGGGDSDTYKLKRWTSEQRDAIIISLQRALMAIHACDATFITHRYTKFDRKNYCGCACTR